MEINKIPIFEKGKILDKDMLDELKKISLEYIDIASSNHTNGVISGISIKVISDNSIEISKGLIKFNDELFKITKNKKIDIPTEDGLYVCVLEKIEKIENEKFIELKFKIKVIKNEEPKENMFEFFRVIRREGAIIKEPVRFIGLIKEYNTLNIINLKKADRKNENMSPELITLFAKDMLKNKKLDQFEKIVCMFLLNSNYEKEFLIEYLNISIDSNNLDIYLSLEKKYFSKEDNEQMKKQNTIKKNKMLVD